MKLLVLLSLVALAVAGDSDEFDRKKRSPDDLYYFVPSGSRSIAPRTRSFYPRNIFRTSATRSFGVPRGYFIDLDDLYDDRRKRQAVHPNNNNNNNNRQKRSADFEFDDDDYYFYRNPVRAVTYTAPAPRTRITASPSFYGNQRFVYYDFDDRRKKRSADFDDDDYYRFSSAPVYTTYSSPVVQSRTSYSPVVYSAPRPFVYHYDFDDK